MCACTPNSNRFFLVNFLLPKNKLLCVHAWHFQFEYVIGRYCCVPFLDEVVEKLRREFW
jgi:hypothetical protein